MTGGYGQTEAPASISYLTPAEHFVDGRLAPDERLSSVGRPNPLVRVEIVDDRGDVLKQGETGEICVRGDLVMKGYYDAPDKTAETIVDAGCTPATSVISIPKAICTSPTARRT